MHLSNLKLLCAKNNVYIWSISIATPPFCRPFDYFTRGAATPPPRLPTTLFQCFIVLRTFCLQNLTIFFFCLPFQVFFSSTTSQQTATFNRPQRLRLHRHRRVCKTKHFLLPLRRPWCDSYRGRLSHLRHHPARLQAPRFDKLHSEEKSWNVFASNHRTQPRGSRVGWQRSGPYLEHSRFPKGTLNHVSPTSFQGYTAMIFDLESAASCRHNVLTDEKQSDESWTQRIVKFSLLSEDRK